MSYTLTTPEYILTRPNNATANSAFTVISASDNSCFALPLMNSGLCLIQGCRLTFDWLLSPVSNNMRIHIFNQNPVPSFANVNNTGINPGNFSGLFAQYESNTNVTVVDIGGGFSGGTLLFAPPLAITSPNATVYVILQTTTGTTTVANGRIKLDLFIESPIGTN